MKSFDGVSCNEIDVLSTGALRHDRQFALVDSTGQFINAKRMSSIHKIDFRLDPVRRRFFVALRNGDRQLHGQIDEQGEQLSDWLSDFFSLEVSIVENVEVGFPDDLDASGPTVVSTATLNTIASWFELTTDNIRQRFRANIEIDGVEPFWEDRLFRADKQPQPFTIGTVAFGGTNPCQRCVVPTRDPHTGEVTPEGFAKRFSQRRMETLPSWSARERFDHFYRLCTNTRRISDGAGSLRVGDTVHLTGITDFSGSPVAS